MQQLVQEDVFYFELHTAWRAEDDVDADVSANVDYGGDLLEEVVHDEQVVDDVVAELACMTVCYSLRGF